MIEGQDGFTFWVDHDWHFRPHSKRGREWLRNNHYNVRCHTVKRQDGAMLWRALRAEDFELVLVNGPNPPGPLVSKSASRRISMAAWAHRIGGDLEKTMLRLIVSVVFCVELIKFAMGTV
jgi:hypothetical protein